MIRTRVGAEDCRRSSGDQDVSDRRGGGGPASERVKSKRARQDSNLRPLAPEAEGQIGYTTRLYVAPAHYRRWAFISLALLL